MVKQAISNETMLELKIQKMESIIERLKLDVPLEGAKWQAGMIRHYSAQLKRLKEALNGIRRTK